MADALDEAEVTSFLYSNYGDYIQHSTQTVSGKEYLSLQLFYKISRDEIINRADKAKAKAAEIEKTLGLSSLSDYEKIEAANDYLCENCYYDPNKPYTTNDHSAYGALCEGVCVCDGYARSMCLILSDVGVDIQIMIGNAGGGHAWNIVKLDGNWYHVDTCWNDNSRDGKTSTDDYFLIDDTTLKNENRTWNFDFYPKCNSGKYKN